MFYHGHRAVFDGERHSGDADEVDLSEGYAVTGELPHLTEVC
jgi:hypothetical protein